MPISGDESKYRTMEEPQSTMSKAELRKNHKPIMEKRRRARINQCLNEIKTLILEAMNKDPTRHSKLEKADILEMAVKHLQNVQRQQLAIAVASDPSVLRKFKTGFNECANEIDQYIARLEGVDDIFKQNITAHLQKCISGIEQVAHFNFPGFSNAPFLAAPTAANVNQSKVMQNSPDDQNNNPKIQMSQGLHLIPSRLPSGELALLLPNSSSLSYFSSLQSSNENVCTDTASNNQRPSAFLAVVPSSSHIKQSPKDIKDVTRSIEHSPEGFRLVKPYVKRKLCSSADHQVPQITSTSLSHENQVDKQTELKFIKYPINNSLEKTITCPKISVEPLCIITNQSERYKQAQMKNDSAHFEENSPYSVQYQQCQGLLTVAQQDYTLQFPKLSKTKNDSDHSSDWNRFHKLSAGTKTNKTQIRDNEYIIMKSEPLSDGQQMASNSRNDTTNDMWRPW